VYQYGALKWKGKKQKNETIPFFFCFFGRALMRKQPWESGGYRTSLAASQAHWCLAYYKRVNEIKKKHWQIAKTYPIIFEEEGVTEASGGTGELALPLRVAGERVCGVRTRSSMA